MSLAKGWTTRRGPREVRSPIFPYSAAAEGLDRVKGFSKELCHRPFYRIWRGGFDLWWLPFILVLGRKFHSFSTKSQNWGPPWGFKGQGREERRSRRIERRREAEKKKKKEQYAVEEWRLRASVARRLRCQLPLDPIEEGDGDTCSRKTTRHHLCYVCLFLYISEKCNLQLRLLLTWTTPVTTLHGHCLDLILEGFTHRALLTNAV